VVTLLEGYIIPQPVRLRIVFTSAEADRTGTRSITSETYNTSRMIHEVPNSEVLFIQFKAQVALTVGSEVGPFVPNLDSAPVYRMLDAWLHKYLKLQEYLKVLVFTISLSFETTH